MPIMRHLGADEAEQMHEEPAAAVPDWLTEQAIRDWAGDAALQRGRPYSYDAVFHTVRAGDTLKASCQGNQPTPYHVAVTLGAGQVSLASCTCPVGDSGRCKHVVAVLLAYRARPDEFIEVEPLDQALERRDKTELVALIRRMVERYPDLERMLTLPVSTGAALLTPAVIERQVRAAVRGSSDWGDGELGQLLDTASAYVQEGDRHSAAVVYGTVARVTLEHYHEVSDEEGDLIGIVQRCVEGLDSCLQAEDDPTQREVLLRALFDIYRWNTDSGGYGAADGVTDALLAQASSEERRLLASWVRVTMPQGEDFIASFARQTYGSFLLDLEFDQLDDAGFIQIARQAGLTHQLVGRLLELGRADEAAAEAGKTPPVTLLSLVELFSRHGHDELIERQIRERSAADPSDHTLLNWIRQRAIERNDLGEAVDLSERMFWQQPSFIGYDRLRKLASQHGVWAEQRPAIMARLEAQESHGLLTEIHLAEGEIEQAIARVPQVRNWWPYGTTSLNIRVAEAAEESHPHDAIRIYTEAARRLIGQQGRQNYTIAAGHLSRVRALYAKLGEEQAWDALIGEIRSTYKRLRALREELDKAHL